MGFETKEQNASRLQSLTPGEAAVTMEVYTDFQSCQALESEWDAFTERVSGDIFLTYDWCRIWWDHYGQGRSLRVYVFRDGDRWVGLVPMFLEKVSLGPISLHRAKMVASDFISSQFRPAIDHDYLRPVLESLVRDLESFDCHQVVLGPLAGRYAHSEELIDCLQSLGANDFRLQSEQNVIQSYYPLADTYEEWFERFSSSQRNLFRREYRRLERQDLSFEFEPAEENSWEEMFEDFVQLHQEDWNGKGKLGYFGDWPQSLAFHREMAQAQQRKGRLRLFRVRCNDGSRAYSYNYRCGDMYFSILLGRTLFYPHGVSLGRLLHSEVVRHATNESVQWIDAMRGKYEYKSQQGGEYFPLRILYLNQKGLANQIRIHLFQWTAWLFHTVYYKIYFCRLASKLPPRWRGGLWKSWIRACGDLRSALRPSKLSKINVHS